MDILKVVKSKVMGKKQNKKIKNKKEQIDLSGQGSKVLKPEEHKV